MKRVPACSLRDLFRCLRFAVLIGLLCGWRSTGVVSAQQLTLWYESPASQWVETLPVGNGRLGAMVFGGIEHERR